MLDASKITVKNLSADSITSGGLSARYLNINNYLIMNQGSTSNSLNIGGTGLNYVTRVEIGATTFHVNSTSVKLGGGGVYSYLGFFWLWRLC